MTSIRTKITAFLLVCTAMVIEYVWAQNVEPTLATGTPSANADPSKEAQIVNIRYLSSDERAALWACFLGGCLAFAGLGVLFYELRVRKYEQFFPYRYRKKKSKRPRREETTQ